MICNVETKRHCTVIPCLSRFPFVPREKDIHEEDTGLGLLLFWEVEILKLLLWGNSSRPNISHDNSQFYLMWFLNQNIWPWPSCYYNWKLADPLCGPKHLKLSTLYIQPCMTYLWPPNAHKTDIWCSVLIAVSLDNQKYTIWKHSSDVTSWVVTCHEDAAPCIKRLCVTVWD